MAEHDHADKLRNILCQAHNKKIQFINVGIESDLVFVCSDCLKKQKAFCMANMDDFVSVEEFKLEFLAKLSKEMVNLKGTIATQITHMMNHVDSGTDPSSRKT